MENTIKPNLVSSFKCYAKNRKYVQNMTPGEFFRSAAMTEGVCFLRTPPHVISGDEIEQR